MAGAVGGESTAGDEGVAGAAAGEGEEGHTPTPEKT